jgi:hypothetical protein
MEHVTYMGNIRKHRWDTIKIALKAVGWEDLLMDNSNFQHADP